MTQKELREFVFKLVKTMVAKKCYIKGYGDKFRVMDKDHNPEINIDKRAMSVLKHNNIVKLDGLVWVLRISESPFVAAIDVKLPIPA